MKVLVLGGGRSAEREVSLRSAAAVRRALDELGYIAEFADPADGQAALVAAIHKYDVVLPILHGAGGEDGMIQAMIEQCGKPYLGARVEASRLCFDKAVYKRRLEEAGILIPRFAVVDATEFGRSELVRRPFVLKPIDGGSSVDTFVVRRQSRDLNDVEAAFRRHERMLLEELIEGVEITVAVLDETAFGVVEIVPPEGQEFDYENKYNGATKELCPPENVSSELQRQAEVLAERIHRLMGVRHLSRTDMIVTDQGQLYVLETNTMPGLTDQSLFPKAAVVAGLEWNQLVERLVKLAASS